MLLLTLAKHSDNYFCWFQIAFSSRVWSQQVFFFFLHAEHALSDTLRGAEAKMMAFFHFYPVALWHSLNRPFVLRQGKQGRGSQMRSGLVVTEENRARTSLSEGSCSQGPVFLHIPSGSPMNFPLCVHTHNTPREDRGPPTPPWSCTTTQRPSQKSPDLVFPLSNALKSTAHSRSP